MQADFVNECCYYDDSELEINILTELVDPLPSKHDMWG